MKQGKSYTAKKSKLKSYEKLGFSRKQVDQAAELTTLYLKTWTEQEFKNLTHNQKLPVIWPLGSHGFLVGRKRIEKLNDFTWRVLDHNNDTEFDFSRRISAVFYCLTDQINKINLSREILRADWLVGKLELDVKTYANTMRKNIKRKDYFRADLAELRLINCQFQLDSAIQELKKTLNTAKYLKVQERLL
jgi:hypothetical protein